MWKWWLDWIGNELVYYKTNPLWRGIMLATVKGAGWLWRLLLFDWSRCFWRCIDFYYIAREIVEQIEQYCGVEVILDNGVWFDAIVINEWKKWGKWWGLEFESLINILWCHFNCNEFYICHAANEKSPLMFAVISPEKSTKIRRKKLLHHDLILFIFASNIYGSPNNFIDSSTLLTFLLYPKFNNLSRLVSMCQICTLNFPSNYPPTTPFFHRTLSSSSIPPTSYSQKKKNHYKNSEQNTQQKNEQAFNNNILHYCNITLPLYPNHPCSRYLSVLYPITYLIWLRGMP